MARIRRKLGVPLIHTVRGVGYRLQWQAEPGL
jgi:DNA-binding response OmpR family regulator